MLTELGFATLIALIVWIFTTNLFARIARDKGHSLALWWFVSFILPILGILGVIALPDRNSKRNDENWKRTEQLISELRLIRKEDQERHEAELDILWKISENTKGS